MVMLWEEQYGNAVEEFETEDEALAFVHRTIELRGERAVSSWAMDLGESGAWVRGLELVGRALRVPV